MTAKDVAGQQRVALHIHRHTRFVVHDLCPLSCDLLCSVKLFLRYYLQFRDKRGTTVTASEVSGIGRIVDDIADGVVRPSVPGRVGIIAVIQEIGDLLHTDTFFGVFIKDQSDDSGVAFIDFQIIQLMLALVQPTALDQHITERGRAAFVVPFLYHLTEAGACADRGLSTFSVSLPKADIVEQLIDMVIKALLDRKSVV